MRLYIIRHDAMRNPKNRYAVLVRTDDGTETLCGRYPVKSKAFTVARLLAGSAGKVSDETPSARLD